MLLPDVSNIDLFYFLPSRSRLNAIKPIAVGNSSVESLTSYITRLANSHCLPVGVLMETEIAPSIGKVHGGANLHKIYSYTSALNGTGAMALSLVKALEKLTGQKELQLLTLITLSEVIPQRKLLRQYRAWCPICYQEWYATGQVVYEPLLWSLAVVKVCTSHHCLLCESCPYCHQKNLSLAWHSRSGYCSKCQSWLGSLSNNLSQSSNDTGSSKDELATLIEIAQSVGGLLTAFASLHLSINKSTLSKAFKVHINLISDGNVAEFARQLQLPKNTVWLWCNGKNLPQLDTLVQICCRLNRSLIEFLTQSPEHDICVSVPKTLPSLQSKPKTEARVIDTSHLEQQLKAFLVSHECPPLPMEEIARRLEIHRRTIFRLFPELCQAISAKYDKFQKVCHRQAIEQSRREVKQAVLKLYSEGLYPSEERVAQLISKPGYLRYKQVRATIEEAKLNPSTESKNLGMS